VLSNLRQVRWERQRYDDICKLLRPFLVQSGFHVSKTKFIPVGAMQGVNLASQDGPDSDELRQWYNGPTLTELLGLSYNAPLQLHF
jgi:elongation factor 1 alpha-like protein